MGIYKINLMDKVKTQLASLFRESNYTLFL